MRNNHNSRILKDILKILEDSSSTGRRKGLSAIELRVGMWVNSNKGTRSKQHKRQHSSAFGEL